MASRMLRRVNIAATRPPSGSRNTVNFRPANAPVAPHRSSRDSFTADARQPEAIRGCTPVSNEFHREYRSVHCHGNVCIPRPDPTAERVHRVALRVRRRRVGAGRKHSARPLSRPDLKPRAKLTNRALHSEPSERLNSSRNLTEKSKSKLQIDCTYSRLWITQPDRKDHVRLRRRSGPRCTTARFAEIYTSPRSARGGMIVTSVTLNG